MALVAVALVAAGFPGVAGARVRARALAAHTISGNDNATLHWVPPARGATLLEEGQASGPIPGHVRAHLRVEAAFSGTFTISTPKGSISGHGTANPHGAGAIESFAGTLVISGGTGRYAHAHGRGKLYGTYRRSDYEVVLQLRGTIHY
jgi:hypothetical protein